MTIFEKIVKGEIPCHKLWEDEEFLAFLDIQPVAEGHSLVIPKTQVDPLFRMDKELYLRMMSAVYEVAQLLERAIPCERVCTAVVGFEVPHAHVHLIPAQSMSDFPWPGGQPAEQDELKKLAEKIRVNS